MLEETGAGDLAVLGDMADQKQRGAAPFGKADQLMGGGAQLSDGPGRTLDVVDEHGLDAVDHQDAWCVLDVERLDDVADRGGSCEPQRRVLQTETGGSELNLVRRLLAAHVSDVQALLGKGCCRL